MTGGSRFTRWYAWTSRRQAKQAQPVAIFAAPAPALTGVTRQQRIALGLLAMLRPLLDDRPPLLKLIDEAAASLQAASEVEPVDFLLATVTDAALTSARALQPLLRPLHMSVIIAPSLPSLWRGDAERLESLCRHLLLIGLQRCAAGLVRLRLEPIDEPASLNGLRIVLEDSGPPMQQGQVQRWLAADGENLPIAAHDTSWLMTGLLFHRFAGTATAACDMDGLRLTGSIPCGPLLQPVGAKDSRLAPADPQRYFSTPLVLTLLAAPVRARVLTALQTAGYAVCDVADAPQLLDWAPVLPLFAIVVDTQVAGASPIVLRELARLADHGVLQPVPVWAVTRELATDHAQDWLLAGAAAVMVLPLAPDKLRRLRQRSPATASVKANWFYCNSDDRLRDDLPSRVIAQLPILDSELFARLQQIRDVLQQLAQGAVPPEDFCPALHAIRSMALSLGYMRLAGLMAAMETAAATGTFAARPQNWQVIGEHLSATDCALSLADVPATLTDAGMPPVPGFRL